MLDRKPVVINSVEPLQGQEGTIVTLKGSGFPTNNATRNNCVVIGGMGACARALPDSTSSELKVRIGPVARETEGNLRMWPGLGIDLYTDEIRFAETGLRFSETAIFRNRAPETSADIKFKLTKASPDTYAGYFEKSAISSVELGGNENGPVMRVRFPKNLPLPRHATVDVCVVLKEPTLAIDFSAAISGREDDDEGCLRAIAKGITVNASLIGEKVFADVARNRETGELELYVTKPYLQEGMIAVSFKSDLERSVAS